MSRAAASEASVHRGISTALSGSNIPISAARSSIFGKKQKRAIQIRSKPGRALLRTRRPSREIVDRALAGLVNLTHRGGVGADSRTGDGAGVLTQVPLALFHDELLAAGHGDVAPGELAIAMTFLPTDEDGAKAA